MDLRDCLSENELTMMDNWRNWYAYSNEASASNNVFVSTHTILHEWNKAKNDHLAKLFGNELILTKNITYLKDTDTLMDEMEAMTDLWNGRSYGRKERQGFQFYSNYLDFLRSDVTKQKYSFDTQTGLRNLVMPRSLATNEYAGEDFEIEGQNGKPLKIRHGCKVMRLLSKLANLFGIEGYEDFRLCHSQILNQKTLSGELCISIHPMDYMTMSDNESGWDSCMRWADEGSYRQGTVEMMNSTVVVVAYLRNKEDMTLPNGATWNNKKWRQLFVVDEAVIMGIKPYPYDNDNLTKEVISWLVSLAKDNLGWEYQNTIALDPHDREALTDENENSFCWCFETGSMYSDFGSANYHWMAQSKTLPAGRLHGYTVFIPYSGRSQCMVCGDLDPQLNDDSCLACDNCQNYTCCDCCGDRIDSNDYYIVDDMILCYDCYENNTRSCAVCEDSHFDDNMEQIYIVGRPSPAKTKELEQIWSNYLCPPIRRSLEDELIRTSERYSYWICVNCIQAFENNFLKNGAKVKTGDGPYYPISYVNAEDLNENELQHMTWCQSETTTAESLNQEICDTQFGEWMYFKSNF